MCSIDEDLLQRMRKFRFDKSKSAAAIIREFLCRENSGDYIV